ncbi:MAG: 23S rRNA (uracil(1939)-C(5))-methyltransferase RlmD [Lachnospiraceae bacterium]|nr:23S rRNA (uracil(1939)-C(5))-methyltransferase RlmD [Lachnospiraceae bacterium]
MKKNDIYEITIKDIGNDGEGIGHIPMDCGEIASGAKDKLADEATGTNRGIAVFVKDTVVGDVARVKLVKVKKNYAYGRLEEIIKPSPYRVEPVCVNARRCGGCALMHMSYEKQLDYKWNKVKNCLERIGGVKDVASIMETICGMEKPYNYRNKMQFPVGIDKEGKVLIGFYAGRTHSIIDLNECHIGHPVNDYLVKYLKGWLQKWQDKTGHFIYDEERHEGLVRHILTRVGFTTGELMVCVIINGNGIGKYVGDMQAEKDLKECIHEAVKQYNMNQAYAAKDYFLEIKFTSLSVNINREKTNRILGDKCVTLCGQDYISDYIGDIKFNISPMSFYQVNPAQTKVLYDKAVDYAGLTGDEVVWDMYCGIGTISLCLAKKARKVYGVEIVPQAIEDAKENARINGLDNTEFFCGKAEEVVPGFYRGELGQECGSVTDDCTKDNADISAGKHPDVIVVDPPRKGCDSVLLDTIENMAPKRLVYVSCDPATLARDVKILSGKGFKLEKVGVVDQFGHSGHVESVVLLSQQNPDDYIEVELELDEMDLTTAESKATYKEIQEYVLKAHGLKVSNLYISQVKRKCGIEVGANYNLPKSEDSRQPQCPEEKEKAIKDTLEHFGMI